MKLRKLCGDQKWIEDAPLNLLFCIDWYRMKKLSEFQVAPFSATSSFRHFWISFQDTIIAAQNLCTAADSLRLGSVYIGTVLECFPELKRLFKLPDGVFPVVLLCVGYPLKKPGVRGKLAPSVIVHEEKYKKMKKADLIDAYNRKYNNIKIEVTNKRLKMIKQVCTRVHGSEFAEKCLDRIRKNGYITITQYYFGLHYVADLMARDNEKFLKTMEDFGFSWFQK